MGESGVWICGPSLGSGGGAECIGLVTRSRLRWLGMWIGGQRMIGLKRVKILIIVTKGTGGKSLGRSFTIYLPTEG